MGIQQETYESRKLVEKEQLLENSANSGTIQQLGRLEKAAKQGNFQQQVQKQLAQVKFLPTGLKRNVTKPRGDFGLGGVQRGGSSKKGSLELNPAAKFENVLGREHGMKVESEAKKWTTGGYMKDGTFGSEKAYFIGTPKPQMSRLWQKAQADQARFGVVTGTGQAGWSGLTPKAASKHERDLLQQRLEGDEKSLKKRTKAWEKEKVYGEEANKKVDEHILKRQEFAQWSPMKAAAGLLWGGKAAGALTGSLFGGKEEDG